MTEVEHSEEQPGEGDSTGRRGAVRWIERNQGLLIVPLVVGALLIPIVNAEVGFTVLGGTMVAAGMIPVVSGRYRSRVMNLRGFPARLRGVGSVLIGALIIWAANAQ